MTTHTAWTKEQIQNFLRQENLVYQKIVLPHGLSTPGKDRKGTCDLIFQEKLTGKSVLDIGACLGYFCIEAIERGAARVVGWEIDAERIRQARRIAEIKGMHIEYAENDIDTVEPKEMFDVVLCLNVLHHVFNPIAVLEKLIRHTREKLILEVAALGTRDRKIMGLSRLQSHVLSTSPTIVVGKGSTTSLYNQQRKYFFTKAALLNILQYHSHHFAKIDVYDSEFRERFILVAHKRRIKHLIVIAGPKAAGKTALINKLLSKTCPEFADVLGVEDFHGWDTVEANELPHYQKLSVDGLLFHYNFLRPYRRSAATQERDEALHILETADKVSFVTIYTEPERLRQQFAAGGQHEEPILTTKDALKHYLRKVLQLPGMKVLKTLPGGKSLFKKVFKTASKRQHDIIRKAYQNSKNIMTFYRNWFKYVDRLDIHVEHDLVVSMEPEFVAYPRSEWETRVHGRRNES